MRRLTLAECDRIATMREAGKTYGQIALALNCSTSAVRWQCLRLGADAPGAKPLSNQRQAPTTIRRGDHKVRYFTVAEDEQLLALECEGLSLAEMARRLNRRTNTIKGRLMTLARHQERASSDRQCAA